MQNKTINSIVYDYSKLSGKIKEVFGTQGKFAEAMNLSERSVSLKMNNLRPWTKTEMAHALELLGISVNHLTEYFYTIKVQ